MCDVVYLFLVNRELLDGHPRGFQRLLDGLLLAGHQHQQCPPSRGVPGSATHPMDIPGSGWMKWVGEYGPW